MPISTRKRKTKQRKSMNVLFAPKSLIVIPNLSDMKSFIQEKPTRVKLIIVDFDTRIVTLLTYQHVACMSKMLKT